MTSAEDVAQFGAFAERIKQFQSSSRNELIAPQRRELQPGCRHERSDDDADRRSKALTKDLETLGAALFASASKRVYAKIDRGIERRRAG